MPNFRYQARDSAGRPVEGTVQAADIREAQRRLLDQGIRTTSLVSAGTQPPSAAVHTQASAASPLQPMPQVRPRIERPAPPPTLNVQTAPAKPLDIVKTRWGTDKDNYFLFTQLASHLKAGINPADSFERLSNNTVREDYRQALQEAARSGVEGKRASDVLRRYPYLFPPHVVGLYAAGETGGFLPEACEAIAGQADSARKFGRPFVWLGALALMTLICAPMGYWVVESALATWPKQEAAGGMAPGFPTLIQTGFEQLMWPYGPIFLLMAGAFVTGWFWWRSMPRRPRRHALTLRLPLAGKRAWSEGMAVFAWTLSHLSKAAIPPRAALLAAAEAIPNQSAREEIEHIGRNMGDNTPLSQALGASPRLPAEFKPLLVTGEMTGDVPGQLLIVSRSSRDEQIEVENMSKWRVGCWAILMFALGFVFVAWLLYGHMYPRLFEMFGGDT